jgi:hypothetical protein
MAAHTERLEFRAEQSFIEGLEALAKESEVSRAEIIRRSVNLYALAVEEAKKGNQLQPVPYKKHSQAEQA